ncbi:MAG: hypothetical protein ACI8RD_007179 [Bacillariaceae sp.]|jgi:hypothetical protein
MDGEIDLDANSILATVDPGFFPVNQKTKRRKSSIKSLPVLNSLTFVF